MTQGIHSLTADMVNQLNKVDVITNNLANANTVGFKEDKLVQGEFNHYLTKMRKDDKIPQKESLILDTIPKIDGKYINDALGSITPTGNKLDFALMQEDLFFKIDNNGEIQYTRDGTFKVLDGHLVTQNGDSVLDANNNPIKVLTNTDDLMGKIAVVKLDFNDLAKVGNNNYKLNKNGDETLIKNSKDYIMQGAVEKSNVNTVYAMVNLIESQRAFERSQKAISGIDKINETVINSIGNNK
jgi:flagellar basal-body rod protein FlgG